MEKKRCSLPSLRKKNNDNKVCSVAPDVQKDVNLSADVTDGTRPCIFGELADWSSPWWLTFLEAQAGKSHPVYLVISVTAN